MKIRKMKSNLDERQELKLLKIEHNGCWIAFWGIADCNGNTNDSGE